MSAEHSSQSTELSSSGLRTLLAAALVLATGGAFAEEHRGDYEHQDPVLEEAAEPANPDRPCPTVPQRSDDGRERDRHSLDSLDFRRSQGQRGAALDSARNGLFRSGYPDLPIDTGLHGTTAVDIGDAISRLGNLIRQQGAGGGQPAPRQQPHTTRYNDGATSAVMHGADGSVTLVDPDGTRHELNEDGTTTLRHPDGRTTTLPPIRSGRSR